MSVLLWIVAVVVALAVIVLLLATLKPNTFRVERSAVINAPPEKVFPFVSDFHQWRAWSPWENMDADLKRSYGGAAAGKGATYAWEGRKSGTGRMEITEATPSSRVLIKLDFLKPIEAHNTADFRFTPEGGGTRVDWAMYGPSLFISKVMSAFVSIDKMLGKNFEQGLAALKAAAEK